METQSFQRNSAESVQKWLILVTTRSNRAKKHGFVKSMRKQVKTHIFYYIALISVRKHEIQVKCDVSSEIWPKSEKHHSCP